MPGGFLKPFCKKRFEIAGVGNGRTRDCILGAGTEHHILTRASRVNLEIQNIRSPLDELKRKKEDQDKAANKIFQKMIELKIFHDRAKNKKLKLADEFKKKKDQVDKKDLKNIVTLVTIVQKRILDKKNIVGILLVRLWLLRPNNNRRPLHGYPDFLVLSQRRV